MGAKKDIVENFAKVFREKAEIFAEAVHDGTDTIAEVVHEKSSALSRPKKLIILGVIISFCGLSIFLLTKSLAPPIVKPLHTQVKTKHKKHHKRSAKGRHKVRGAAKTAALQIPFRSAANQTRAAAPTPVVEQIPETGIQYLARIKANYRPITDPSKVTSQAAADSLMLYRVTNDKKYLNDCQKYMAVLMIYLKAEIVRNRDHRDADQIMQLLKINRQMQIIGAGRPEWNNTLESYITMLTRH
ncbi:MAG: hypothetical protein NTY08_09890 [Proteobacteria bacterium]|nr:hypothetical protein [Pseudomonadota bacterium]